MSIEVVDRLLARSCGKAMDIIGWYLRGLSRYGRGKIEFNLLTFSCWKVRLVARLVGCISISFIVLFKLDLC